MHGTPSRQICDDCNLYGLIPRFSERKCPKCGKETRTIGVIEIKKRFNILCYERAPYPGFEFVDAGNPVIEEVCVCEGEQDLKAMTGICRKCDKQVTY